MARSHIKRDGRWLCGQQDNPVYQRWGEGHIKFSKAHNVSLKGFCAACQKKYFEILDKRKDPLIIK